MDLLVLGGTRFVGRAVVADALDRGWQVTALNRGQTRELPGGVTALVADRTNPQELARALGTRTFDLVVDTWAGAPRVVRAAANLLRDGAGRYGYVSSRSVYTEGRPAGGDESWPTVEASPDAELTDYAADKRGGELAALAAFPGALLARAGLILGPYEDIGRLPWWLDRIARGGPVVAPGRPERPLQYVDARDLAAWLLDGLAAGLSGPVDVTAPSGHATTQRLLAACVDATGSDAELVWFSEPELEAAGAEPWVHLPCWVPEGGEFAGFLEGGTARAIATRLRPRPVEQTVADTSAWWRRDGLPAQRPDRATHGLPREIEAALLDGRRTVKG